MVQPRFTGALLLDAGDLSPAERRYSAVAFTLGDGRILHYRDIRRLGTVALMSPRRFACLLGRRLAPSHLTRPSPLTTFRRATKLPTGGEEGDHGSAASRRASATSTRTSRSGARASTRRGARIGSRRTAPRRSASPRRRAPRSDRRPRHQLPRLSRRPRRTRRFAARLDAYGRAGLPCRRCGARLIGTHAVDGRATVFCARCQR